MKKFIVLGIAVCTSIYTLGSQAADLTSTADLTSKISAHIAQLQTADFIDPMQAAIEIQSYSLRHLYLQIETNSSQINLLRVINGLEPKKIPELELKSWSFEDVETLLKGQMESLKELDAVYNIKSAPTELSTKANSLDALYVASLTIERQIKSLGIPGQSPGDSFKYSSLLLNTVKQIAKHQKVLLPRPKTEKVTGKRPNDNYLYALSVAAELQYYQTEFLKADLKGDIIVPTALDRNATSDDAISVMKTILADMIAIKLAIGDTNPLNIPEPDINRTPSDVYKQLEFVYDIIFAMEDAAAEAS